MTEQDTRTGTLSHPFDSTAPVYVVKTKYRQEQAAQEHLVQQGYRIWPRSVDQNILIPRHILVQPCRPEQSLSPIRSTRGVSELILHGPDLAILQAHSIAELCESESFTSMDPQQRVMVLMGLAERDTLAARRRNTSGRGTASPV